MRTLCPGEPGSNPARHGASRSRDGRDYVHEKDGSRIAYEKVCKEEGKEVPDDEIVKAFEFEKDEYVAMDDSGLAAIVKYVMRNKQQLGCLRVRDGAITLEKMYFADEIRPLDDIVPSPRPRVAAKELGMATDLISKLKSRFDPDRYEDTYREALCDVIERKRKGETIKAPKAPKAADAPDLMELLQASLEQSRPKRAKRAKASSRS